jgi:hypothetical protein
VREVVRADDANPSVDVATHLVADPVVCNTYPFVPDVESESYNRPERLRLVDRRLGNVEVAVEVAVKYGASVSPVESTVTFAVLLGPN